LQSAVDAELDGYDTRSLSNAVAALSGTYAGGGRSPREAGVAHAAYVGVRLPATYAAVRATLAMCPRASLERVHSVLDLGAGPGTASWAARDACDVAAVTQIDRSPAMLALARRLADRADDPVLTRAVQRQDDIGGGGPWDAADLVVAAYALAELERAARRALVASAWAAARLLVLVEPGTPEGFSRIHEARTSLIAAGASLLAPCPHEATCPMHATPGEWCHFAVRVPRTRRHRQLKGGTLGYEDEKFSCLVASKLPEARVPGRRVLRHPRIDAGRIGLVLCAPERAERLLVTRRDPAFRAARKIEWGDTWPPPE
jgi:ribosomal protein RSM22 (predicted rRNA methylase)